MFAGLSGKGELPPSRTPQQKASGKQLSPSRVKKTAPQTENQQTEKQTVTKTSSNSIVDNLGMSIKIEVNLPSDASKETYDNIFKSIRENLING